jgi:hypothetical protein
MEPFLCEITKFLGVRLRKLFFPSSILLFGSVLRQYISTESPLFSTRLVYRTTSSYMHTYHCGQLNPLNLPDHQFLYAHLSLWPTQRNKNKSFRTLSDTSTYNGNEHLCSRCNNVLFLFAQNTTSLYSLLDKD